MWHMSPGLLCELRYRCRPQTLLYHRLFLFGHKWASTRRRLTEESVSRSFSQALRLTAASYQSSQQLFQSKHQIQPGSKKLEPDKNGQVLIILFR